ATTITQQVVKLPKSEERLKRAVLRKLIKESEDLQNGIIFCNRKKNVDVIAKSLQSHGFDARPIHGDLAQSFRMETLQAFRDGELKLLVASDVAARGLDIPEVSHVFNFSVPVHAEDYVHRIGRTGRAGRKGHTIMLVTPDESKAFDAVLRVTGLDDINEIDMGDFFTEYEETGSSRGKDKGRGRKSEKSDRADKTEKSERKASSDRKERRTSDRSDDRRSRGRGRRDRDDDVKPVVGFGDHVPAFLQVEAS
ncbi:MAG: C-terminal helicase domain-containing protein, partial [Pseudomonadota bacterium]